MNYKNENFLENQEDEEERNLRHTIKRASALMSRLEEIGIATAEASYEGADGSGQIEFVEFRDANDEDILVEDGIEEEFRSLAFDYLESKRPYWSNNGGGFGLVSIEVRERTITLGYTKRVEEFYADEDSLVP